MHSSPVPIDPRPTMRELFTFLNAEQVKARATVTLFEATPLEEWRPLAHDVQLTYGEIDLLLDLAREEFDREVKRAYWITVIVLRRVRCVYVPRGGEFLRRALHGRAWKEHGNTLLIQGRFRAARCAARRAIRIFSADTLLLAERASASVLAARVAQELQQTDEAIALLRECREVFHRLGEERRSLQVAMIEASILFNAKDYAGARSAYLATQATAERLGDTRELARILNNLGECETYLEHFESALTYYDAALTAFDRENMLAERQRAFWGKARVHRALGELNDAVVRLLQVRREFEERGMIVQAAEAGLDLVELLAATESDLVESTCKELIQVFSKAGLHQNVRIALAYLSDQARLNASAPITFQKDLRDVRAYFKELQVAPDAVFKTPTPAPH